MKRAVFITGAHNGTGRAIAEHFAGNGWNVIITSRDCARAEEAAKLLEQKFDITARGYACDIGNEQQIIDIFSHIDKEGLFVETVVLNAADLGFGKDPAKGQDFWTVPIEEVKRVFETNLIWNYTIIRQAALRMREKGKGAVVFFSSNTAYRAIANRAAYCASKGGINALSKALAVDLGPFGIRVNAVLPGTIKTQRWEEMGTKRIVDGSLTPIGDISDFQDLANAAFFLGTDLSRNITGTELVVDGGMSCQLYPQLLNTLKAEKIKSMDKNG